MAKYRGVLKDAAGNELYPTADGFNPGDEIVCGAFACIAFIAGTGLYIQCPIDRPVYATGINFSSFKVAARIPGGGYLFDGTTQLLAAGLELKDQVNGILISYGGIRVQVVANTGWKNSGGTTLNNMPIVCNVSYTGTFS